MGPFRWLGWFAVAVIVGHHVGTIFGPLGEVGGRTEWADWIDLLTPYAVVGTAVGSLVAARAGRLAWLLAAVGAVAYADGHGIHLAANSISNARGPAPPAHLWDEVLGHYLWYGGLYLLVLALAVTLADRPRPTGAPRGPAWPLAVLFGLTAATNGIEGGTAYLTLVVAVAFTVYGWRHRAGAGALLVASYGVTFAALVGWGLYWAVAEGRAFPQFSELGWI